MKDESYTRIVNQNPPRKMCVCLATRQPKQRLRGSCDQHHSWDHHQMLKGVRTRFGTSKQQF